MYTKEIIQLISLPIMIYVVYKVSFWLYNKLEAKGFLNEKNKRMLIAIPTISNKSITNHFGRMTEITFLEVENNQIKKKYAEKITSYNGSHKENCKHQERHEEIKNKICKADTIIYKSLCKNWKIRLADCTAQFKKTDNTLLVDLIEEINKK